MSNGIRYFGFGREHTEGGLISMTFMRDDEEERLVRVWVDTYKAYVALAPVLTAPLSSSTDYGVLLSDEAVAAAHAHIDAADAIAAYRRNKLL